MRKKLKSFIAFICALTLAGGIAVLAGCNDRSSGGAHTQHVDANNDGKCDECGEDMPDDGKPDDDNPGGGDNPGGDTGDGPFADDPHNTEDSLLLHAEGETVVYRFEAECTDLRGKNGPGYSGSAPEGSMATYGDGASNEGGCVSYLYAPGMTLNFLVVSDRDVENATISLCLGAEFIAYPVSPDLFTLRVDPVTNVDLNPATEDGALGAWDQAFMQYYTVEDTGGYIIDEFECPAGSAVDGTALSAPGAFQKFTISTKLSLKAGVNSVSIVITGMPLEAPTGTMVCRAPVVDYMEITTSAQLGFFDQQENGYGDDGLSIVG